MVRIGRGHDLLESVAGTLVCVFALGTTQLETSHRVEFLKCKRKRGGVGAEGGSSGWQGGVGGGGLNQ